MVGHYNDKPMYKKDGGDATIYFKGFWKLTDSSDSTDGWLYSMVSETYVPPEGLWTTEGHDGGDADPPPMVSKQNAIQDVHREKISEHNDMSGGISEAMLAAVKHESR